ncbi:MAG: coproporphyrinogen dehydrogenase HemZ, partial [Lachnospiraceae bacterium]|nr:coproporphyrinogen dehydrogenase HemZ [Lachnospiraceae bacterium]
MFIIKSNKAQFEYDIHSLVKAFYPEEDVRILTPESVIKDKKILELPVWMQITFDEKKVTIQILENIYTLHVINDYKNEFKKFIYTSLQEETGISLPWGNLTGIRPTKIAMTMMEEGKSDEEIHAFLREEHFVSMEKTALSMDIAARERRILDALHYENGYSLYIGIPFCPTTCLYCSFTSFPIALWKDKVADYL